MPEQDAMNSEQCKANPETPCEANPSAFHVAAKEKDSAASETIVKSQEMGTAETTSTTCYSAFSLSQKRLILLLTAFAGFSPMSSFIFYPAITSIASGIGVSVELINLTITSYMVVSGVTPAILGNVAGKGGRRPVYIAALSIYIIANIGLALQNSFPALLILRMIQSAGSSGQFKLVYIDDRIVDF